MKSQCSQGMTLQEPLDLYVNFMRTYKRVVVLKKFGNHSSMIPTSRSDLLGHKASTSSKKITQGAEFLARWKTCRTARSLSPTYLNIRQEIQRKDSSTLGFEPNYRKTGLKWNLYVRVQKVLGWIICNCWYLTILTYKNSQLCVVQLNKINYYLSLEIFSFIKWRLMEWM